MIETEKEWFELCLIFFSFGLYYICECTVEILPTVTQQSKLKNLINLHRKLKTVFHVALLIVSIFWLFFF